MQIFRLVRDAIASVPQALAPAEYVRKQVQVQAEGLGIMGKLPKGATLSQYLRSALTFLSMSKEEHAARTQRSGSPLELLALAPYLTFDDSTQSFRWLGTAAASTDAALLPLDALHFERFASAHGGPYIGGGGLRSLHAPPMKANKGGLSLPPGSAEQLATMRRQELERFEQPDQPYTYTLRDGSASAVAPIGKKSSGGKARDHFLLRQAS